MKRPQPGTTELGERERQVLLGIADGLTNARIATRLHLSEDTVKTYARWLFQKLGAHDRAHAVALAVARGDLVRDPSPMKRGLVLAETAARVPAALALRRGDNGSPTITLSADDQDVTLLASAMYPQDRTAPWAIERSRDALRRLVGA